MVAEKRKAMLRNNLAHLEAIEKSQVINEL